MKKNICFLVGNLSSSGGTERVTSLIANEIAEEDGYNISILSLVDGKTPFFDLNPLISIHSLYDKKISFKSNFLSTVWKIRKFLQEYQIDTLIVVDTISCIFTVPALIGLKIKHICWEHFNFINNNGVKLRDFSRKLAVRHCDYVITLTEKDKNVWLKNLKNIHAQIINIANPCPFPIQDYRKEKNTKTVLAVGRLTHVKGFDMLLEAWFQVNKLMPEWKLKIVGDGEDKLILSEFIKRNKLIESVVLVGNTNNVSKYYEEAEIFCLSSRFEGFPMVLLEAQAFGLPIVAFDCETGPAEIVEHNINGLLVESGNIIGLTDSLLELINLSNIQYKNMSSNAVKNSTRYSVNSIMKKWLAII